MYRCRLVELWSMEFSKQLGQKKIQPWKVEESSESNGEIRISLDDKAHIVPKHTVVVSP